MFCISPWNWPLFCQVNVVLPAILAGNTVILKPSPQTPLSGECFLDAFKQAGLPADVLQVVHLTQEQTIRVVGDHRTDFVNFTGSVANGHAITKAAAETFKGLALEVSWPFLSSTHACKHAGMDADMANSWAERTQPMFGPTSMSMPQPRTWPWAPRSMLVRAAAA